MDKKEIEWGTGSWLEKEKAKKNRRKRGNKNKIKGQNGKIQRGIELKSKIKKREKLKSNKE